MTNEEAHRLAREEGVSRRFYAIVKAFMVPFMRLPKPGRVRIAYADPIAAGLTALGLGAGVAARKRRRAQPAKRLRRRSLGKRRR